MSTTAQYTTKDIARFYSKVSTIPTDQGCLEWMAGCTQDGYGQFFLERANCLAHRVAWEIVNGPIPAGLVIRHMCNNPCCVNPEHLLTGTYADNVADMMRSGRWMNAPNTYVRPVRPTDAERFYAKVSKTPTDTGCLEWLGCCSPRGYGQFGWKGKIYTAHRVAWELVNGPIPDGSLCCHKCDNRKCCNPAHIFLGTHADNMRDMVDKGRHVSVRGEQNYNTKLTEQDVIAIRGEKFAGWRRCDIAQHFGISGKQVGIILSRKNWAHIDATQDAARENERPPAAKLTEQDVIAIRSDLYREWTLAAIGKQFGITESQASNILNRKSWAHVDAPHEIDPINGKRDLRAKLTAEQVLEIRSDLYSGWMQVEIAQHFGISKSQVCNILRRKVWAHI